MPSSWVRPLVVCFVGACLAVPARGQSALPAVAETDAVGLREPLQRLLDAHTQGKLVLPAALVKELPALLADAKSAAKIPPLLDAHCLIGVQINPESRVKAARGPLPADLRLDQPVDVLVRVHNEAGVTAALEVGGPHLRGKAPEAGRWLEAAFVSVPTQSRKLTGARLEYLPLRLTAREAGKREATLHFDVGQGTQDLGFRAEVPILFTVKAMK